MLLNNGHSRPFNHGVIISVVLLPCIILTLCAICIRTGRGICGWVNSHTLAGHVVRQ